jgi:hypothetical protein
MLSSECAFALPTVNNAPANHYIVPIVLPQSQNTTAPQLTVLPMPDLQLKSTNDGLYNVGDVNILDSSHIDREYKIRNDNKTALTIVKLQPSCGCTSASILDNANASQPGKIISKDAQIPAIIAPGEVKTVIVSVNLLKLSPGGLEKAVGVFVEGASTQSATLQLTGVYTSSIAISPALLNFDKVQSKAAKSITVSVEVDSRLVTNNNAPKLISSNPDIEISAAPSVSGNPSSLIDSAKNKNFISENYTVSLKKSAAIGPFRAVISTDPIPLPNSDGSESEIKPVSAIAIGEVVGDINASPKMVDFGAVSYGSSVTKEVSVTFPNNDPTDEATVTISSKYITASFPTEPNDGLSHLTTLKSVRTTRTLIVSIDKSAPLGSLSSDVILTLGNGERVDIPVIANVMYQMGALSK